MGMKRSCQTKGWCALSRSRKPCFLPSLRAFIPLHLQLSLSKLLHNMLTSGPATPALVARAITLAESHVRLRPGKY